MASIVLPVLAFIYCMFILCTSSIKSKSVTALPNQSICLSQETGILTLCAENTFGWFGITNGVETGRTLADGVVTDLHAECMLVVVDAGLIVETLFPQLFGCSSDWNGHRSATMIRIWNKRHEFK